MYEFSVDYDAVDKFVILSIYKHLMVKKLYKITFWVIKQAFTGLLSFRGYLATKCLIK